MSEKKVELSYHDCGYNTDYWCAMGFENGKLYFNDSNSEPPESEG